MNTLEMNTDIDIETLYKEAIACEILSKKQENSMHDKIVVANEAFQIGVFGDIIIWMTGISWYIAHHYHIVDNPVTFPDYLGHFVVNLIIGFVLTGMFIGMVLNAYQDSKYFPPIFYHRYGFISSIYYSIKKHKYEKEFKLENNILDFNAYDANIIKKVIDYLTNEPIQKSHDLIKTIDESYNKISKHINKLHDIVSSLQHSVEVQEDEMSILTLSRIETANDCIVKLKEQQNKLLIQKQEAIDIIAPIESMAQKLNVIYGATNSIQEIQSAYNLIDDTDILLQQNKQVLSILQSMCSKTVGTLNQIQVEINCFENANKEVYTL